MPVHIDYSQGIGALNDRMRRRDLAGHADPTFVAEMQQWHANLVELGWDAAALLEDSRDHGTYDVLVDHQNGYGIWDHTLVTVPGNRQLASTVADAIVDRFDHTDVTIRKVGA